MLDLLRLLHLIALFVGLVVVVFDFGFGFLTCFVLLLACFVGLLVFPI